MTFHKDLLGLTLIYSFSDKPLPYKDKQKYTDYMRNYLPEYRRAEREIIRQGKAAFGWQTPKQKSKHKRLK